MKRFYLNIDFSLGQIINFSNEIVRHMHVVRVKIGELIEIFDGNNNSCQGEVLSLDRRNATLKIIQKNLPSPLPFAQISLAIGLIANDKMDLIIQKAVELGVNNIIPLHSEYSGRLTHDRSANKLAHWQNIIISSCCQCGQNLLPTIALPISIDSLYKKTEYDIKVIMNVPKPDSRLLQSCVRGNENWLWNDGRSVILLVGPEGGFSEVETKQATLHGYQSLQLGNLIMRAETAAISGISILNLYLKKWIVL
ncbi:MAG: rRNA ((1498)-N(3))-methyltransferase [Burkholderiales bacterium]|nr:rRNA ((1498)-N(3))-methyltransferase [Burkholderiales bacterium]